MSSKVTSLIEKKIYPIVSSALDKNTNKFKDNIAKFFNKNHEVLYAAAPYDPIYWNQLDKMNLYNSLGITEEDILKELRNVFYFDTPYNPQCAKEPDVIVLFMAIKYFLTHHNSKMAELSTLYLLFNGKFYASLFAMTFLRLPPSRYKTAMDYVVNNMMTEKYDLKKEGTIFAAIKSMAITYLAKYGNEIKDSNDDDDIGKHIEQLRNREKEFLKHISVLYHEAITDGLYLNYETDNLSEDNFRLTDNDAAKAARYTENTMNMLTSTYVSLDICNKCKDSNIKALEIKDILESILGDNNNLPSIRRAINLIISIYLKEYPNGKVNSIDFISYTLKAKPNTKDKYQMELKEIILKWLDENSPAYRKRKSRIATAISYYKAILMYLTIMINKVANK